MRSRSIGYFFVFAVLLTVTQQVAANIIVNMKNGDFREVEGYQIFYKGSNVQPLTDALTATVTLDPGAIDNNFLLVYSALPIEEQVVMAQNKGAVGVICASSTIAVGGYMQYRMNNREAASQVNITVVEVGYVIYGANDGADLLVQLANDDQIASISIMPDVVSNPWVDVMSSGWIYAWIGIIDFQILMTNIVSMGLFSVANIVMAVIQLHKFTSYYGGCTESMANWVLSIEIASNIIRIIADVDFFGSNFWYPDWAVIMLGELCFPFVIASFLLFILYWHELMTNESIIVHPFIVKMRIPFFVISSFFLVLQVTKNTVQNLTTFTSINIVTSAFYLVSLIFIIVFFTITGTKLLKRLSNNKAGKRSASLKRSTIRTLVNGGFMLIFVVLAVLFATGLIYTPIGFPLAWYIAYCVINAASLTNILAFELPVSASSRSNHTSSNNSHNSNNSVHMSGAKYSSDISSAKSVNM